MLLRVLPSHKTTVVREPRVRYGLQLAFTAVADALKVQPAADGFLSVVAQGAVAKWGVAEASVSDGLCR